MNGVLRLTENAISDPAHDDHALDRAQVLAIVQALLIPPLTPHLVTAGVEKALARLGWALVANEDALFHKPLIVIIS